MDEARSNFTSNIARLFMIVNYFETVFAKIIAVIMVRAVVMFDRTLDLQSAEERNGVFSFANGTISTKTENKS